MLLAGIAAPALAGDVSVQIDGVRSRDGQIICRLFKAKSKFPRSGYFKSETAPISGGRGSCLFKNVSAGDYAIAIAHDSNSNNKLDMNFLGIPSEGFGFSNNVSPKFSAPKFKDAAFDVATDGATLRIKMIYR
ncbi:MAG: DUF2141 domain-containing protein [Sphingorhabdus sp.]|uniref:DUF2141 domain-containing protein n=1 Tax=Sphingorhabdus sp. TaxID=1902408 RepID=UPI0038FD23D2